jgi:hypothetical protein
MNYEPIIPRHRPVLQAAFGAIGASILWGIAVIALCERWQEPQQAALKSDRLDWDGLPRPPHIEPLAVQAPEPKPAEIVNISPTPTVPVIVPREDPSRRPQDAEPLPRAPPPDTSPSERSMIAGNKGCLSGGTRTNFYVRGVLHWRCRY